MFVGDFNSKLEAFGCAKENSSGQMLKTIQSRLNLIYLNNDEHTDLDRAKGSTDILDMAFILPNLTKHDIQFLIGDDLGSDHLPIEISIDAQPHRNTHTNPVRYKFDQTDREVFESPLEAALSYRRIITDNNILEIQLTRLRENLLRRGYEVRDINNESQKITNFTQSDVLFRKKHDKPNHDILPFIFPYDQTNKLIGPILRKHWEIIENDRLLHTIWPKPPILVLKRNQNLCDRLVHTNFKSTANNQFIYHHCSKSALDFLKKYLP